MPAGRGGRHPGARRPWGILPPECPVRAASGLGRRQHRAVRRPSAAASPPMAGPISVPGRADCRHGACGSVATKPQASTRPALKSDRADTARNPTVSWRTRPTATARAANTCGAGASGTPSRRRPTGRPPAYAKAHAADGHPASAKTATRNATPSTDRSTGRTPIVLSLVPGYTVEVFHTRPCTPAR